MEQSASFYTTMMLTLLCQAISRAWAKIVVNRVGKSINSLYRKSSWHSSKLIQFIFPFWNKDRMSSRSRWKSYEWMLSSKEVVLNILTKYVWIMRTLWKGSWFCLWVRFSYIIWIVYSWNIKLDWSYSKTLLYTLVIHLSLTSLYNLPCVNLRQNVKTPLNKCTIWCDQGQSSFARRGNLKEI